jgi:hypothetical protein
VSGRVAQVDLLRGQAGLVLSVGGVSLWLTLVDASDVAETLVRALGINERDPDTRRTRGRRLAQPRRPRGKPN